MTHDVPLTHADVVQAAERIAPHVHRTPVMSSASLDKAGDGKLWFKCENFQRTGAFKARGACNAVFALDDDEAARGVATHSSGNHGAALAYAAALRGIACHVVVPQDANPAKKAAIARYGATIIECEPTMAGRESALTNIIERTGARLVHPYMDVNVMAGQGTMAIELFSEISILDTLLVPVGGGGLISGCATVARKLSPRTTIIGVEPVGAADARDSFLAGNVQAVALPETIADGLRATIGEPNLAIIRERVDDIVTVPDSAIAEAMRMMWERLKIVVEPSSAVGLAALLEGRVRLAGGTAGIIVTGGNVDLDRLPW